MSGLGNLYNIPGSDEERNEWTFAHQANHRDIARAIYEQYGVTLPEYVLDPVPLHDPSTWIYQHQLLHDNISTVLGTSNLNLQNVDWENSQSLAGFVQANSSLHKEICDFLGIG